MSYLPGRCRRSHLQLLSLTASPSTAPSSPTAAFKQTSPNRLRRLAPPQRPNEPMRYIVSFEASRRDASTEPYRSSPNPLDPELSAKRLGNRGTQKGRGEWGLTDLLSAGKGALDPRISCMQNVSVQTRQAMAYCNRAATSSAQLFSSCFAHSRCALSPS